MTDETTGKHTPGPWEVGDGGVRGSEHTIYCSDRTGSAVATVKFEPIDLTGRSPHERAANARLIAAAPDLLAACKMVADIAVSWSPITPGDIAQVRAAIAKAEGSHV